MEDYTARTDAPCSAPHAPPTRLCIRSRMLPRTPHARLLLALLLACLPLTGTGCAWLGGSRESAIATQASHDGTAGTLPLTNLRAVFVPASAAIADAYLTNIDPSALQGEQDLASVQGVLLHAHVLTQPRAGRTPIATTATTTTLRLLVLANGQAGLYAGGGFADFDLNGPRLTGTIRGASLRLVRATPGFVDALGPSTLTIRVNAAEDAQTSQAADRVLVVTADAMQATQ